MIYVKIRFNIRIGEGLTSEMGKTMLFFKHIPDFGNCWLYYYKPMIFQPFKVILHIWV